MVREMLIMQITCRRDSIVRTVKEIGCLSIEKVGLMLKIRSITFQNLRILRFCSLLLYSYVSFLLLFIHLQFVPYFLFILYFLLFPIYFLPLLLFLVYQNSYSVCQTCYTTLIVEFEHVECGRLH